MGAIVPRPPPPPAFAYATPEWGRDVIARMPPVDAAVVTVLVEHGLGRPPRAPPADAGPGWQPMEFASLHRVRMAYSAQCYERGWDGPTAKLVWDVLCAIIKPAEDDIPF